MLLLKHKDAWYYDEHTYKNLKVDRCINIIGTSSKITKYYSPSRKVNLSKEITNSEPHKAIRYKKIKMKNPILNKNHRFDVHK